MGMYNKMEFLKERLNISSLIGCVVAAALSWEGSAATIAVGAYQGNGGRVEVDEATGAIRGVWPGGAAESVWASGAAGLWQIAFADGTHLSAADCATNGCRIVREGRSFTYDHPLVTVKVAFRAGTNGVDVCGEVTAKTAKAVTAVDLPAPLVFAPETVDRLYFPQRGGEGLGLALKASFFQPSPPDQPLGWRRVPAYGGYRQVFGGDVAMRPLIDDLVKVELTAAGRRLFPVDVVDWISHSWHRRMVNRACQKGQYDVVLLASPHGPYLSGSHLGGKGTLWRFGSAEIEEGRLALVRGLVRGLVARPKAPQRNKLAVVSLVASPVGGGLSCAPVHAYTEMVRTLAATNQLAFVHLDSPESLRAALHDASYLAILSPYGEALPVARREDWEARLEDLKAWVRKGGQWIEVGGASFFYAMVPEHYLSYRADYPNLFMDFLQLKTVSGATCALYGVRPRPPHAPWANTPGHYFVPGALACGGSPAGGEVAHAYKVSLKEGARQNLPAVRFAFGETLPRAIAGYARANDFGRALAEKMGPEKLATLKRALFVRTRGGTARELTALVPFLPQPSTLHLANYLKGGFDREYPDHLPTNPRFGTDAEHRALIDALHVAGHLYSPYTNPTWWGDNPPGPSFKAAGRSPLALSARGTHYREAWGKNHGWAITYWHPAVRAANRRTVDAFTTALPVDLLFQDQCGARRSLVDFNRASPTPMAYVEGLLAMNEEDCARVPLGTEHGWDRVADCEVGLFGVCLGTVPQSLSPTLLKNTLPPGTWEMEPLAAWLMHDKTLFWMHDLGGDVGNRRVLAWMLALGYNLMCQINTHSFAESAAKREWARGLGDVQRLACSRIAGAPLVAWRHDRAPVFARADFDPADGRDDGVVVAQWGDVHCRVNLGDVPREVEGVRLAAYGFHIEAPGLLATALEKEAPLIRINDKPLLLDRLTE